MVNKDFDASLFPNRLCIAIMILLSIVSATPAVHVHRQFTDNALATTAYTLKGSYRHHPVVEFELLDFTANIFACIHHFLQAPATGMYPKNQCR